MNELEKAWYEIMVKLAETIDRQIMEELSKDSFDSSLKRLKKEEENKRDKRDFLIARQGHTRRR